MTLIQYNKGHKSFMSLENNIKDIVFQDIAKQLGEQNSELVQKFKERGESSNLTEIQDGLTKIILDNYNKDTGEVSTDTKVVGGEENHFKMFYNLVQLVERDITILVANQYFADLEKQNPDFKGAKILQGNASSGVKALRYAKELDSSYIQDITVLEKNKNFPEYFNLLSKYNKLDSSKFKVINQLASKFYITKQAQNITSEQPELYDFIDIEEYGSSIHSIRQAINLLKDGGMISAMFTDMSSLCGPNIIKCYSSYNILRAKMSSLNENAVRVIYSSILDVAAQNNFTIEPIITFQSDFYIKVFFKVHHNRIESQRTLEKLSYVYQCTGCPNYHIHNVAKVEQHTVENIQNGVLQLESSMELQLNNLKVPSKCNICDSDWRLNGPIWNQPLHNYKFIQNILRKLNSTENGEVYSKQQKMKIQSILKLKAYLETIYEERDFDNNILGFNISQITGFFKAKHFPKFDHVKQQYHHRRALARSGYKISRSIIEKNLYKSDAPLNVIFDTVKGWKILNDKLDNQQKLKKKYTHNQPEKDVKEEEQNNQEKIDENSPLGRALKKRQHFYPKFAKLSYYEKEQIGEKIEDPKYLQAKQQKTVFYPNPTENWGPKKPFTVVYTHKFEKQSIEGYNSSESDLSDQSKNNRSDEEK